MWRLSTWYMKCLHGLYMTVKSCYLPFEFHANDFQNLPVFVRLLKVSWFMRWIVDMLHSTTTITSARTRKFSLQSLNGQSTSIRLQKILLRSYWSLIVLNDLEIWRLAGWIKFSCCLCMWVDEFSFWQLLNMFIMRETMHIIIWRNFPFIFCHLNGFSCSNNN